MDTRVAPTEDDLRAITEQLWLSYLDPMGTDPLSLVPAPDGAIGISAAVSVTGAWNGHVSVETSTPAARDATAAMLGLPAEDVSDDDVADALGEMANVIGGGVKSLLAEDCALSLPHVVASPGHRRMWPAVAEVCRLQASWHGEPVVVSVLESRPGSGEAQA